jgi:Cu+-exporting ATPase
MDLEKHTGTLEDQQSALNAYKDHDHTVIDHSTQAHRNDSAEAMYVCPMHPEAMQSEPGRCSICGMFLEEQVQGGHDQ